jgi:pyrroloquinoline quinone (PQQ) biosynthesis protein C
MVQAGEKATMAVIEAHVAGLREVISNSPCDTSTVANTAIDRAVRDVTIEIVHHCEGAEGRVENGQAAWRNQARAGASRAGLEKLAAPPQATRGKSKSGKSSGTRE